MPVHSDRDWGTGHHLDLRLLFRGDDSHMRAKRLPFYQQFIAGGIDACETCM